MPDDLLDPARAPRQFVHDKCGATTRMPDDMVSGYLANPHRYNDWAFCSKCDGFVPHRECHWSGTGEKLDAYFARLKAAVPAPLATAWLTYAAPLVLAVLGGLLGELAGRMWLGALIGLGLGLLLLIARLIGLR